MLPVRITRLRTEGAALWLFLALSSFLTLATSAKGQLCTGTSPPCVLTQGYAGPATAYINGIVWAVAPDTGSVQDSQSRGLGKLYAYPAVTTGTLLEKEFTSTDVWCSSSYALPTVANGSVFVPTFAVSTTGSSFTSCPADPSSVAPRASGVLVYY